MKVEKIHLMRPNERHIACNARRLINGDLTERDARTTERFSQVTCKHCLRKAGYWIDHFVSCNDENCVSFRIYHYEPECYTCVASAYLIEARGGFSAFITNLGVHYAFRCRGWATRLIREIMAYHKPPIQVNIRPHALEGESEPPMSEEQLHGFYAKLGFVEFTPKTTNMIWIGDGGEKKVMGQLDM